MKHVLFIKVRSLGDTVILSSAIQAFKSAHPSCEIDLIVDSRWESLFSTDPLVHSTLGVRRKSGFVGWLRTLRVIRRMHYDAVFCFHASRSTSWLAALSGAPTRIIHHHEIGRKDRFSTAMIPDLNRVKAITERDLDTLRAAGIRPEPTAPRIWLDEPERHNAREVLLNFGLSAPFLALGLGASRPTKRWSRFAEIARWWVETTRGSVFLVGTGSELALVSEIEQSLPPGCALPVVDWPLRECAALLAESRIFMGNDSGPKHLAAAVGVPTVTVFGPEDPLEWHPYLESHHRSVYVPNLPCRKSAAPGQPPWCGLEVCTVEGHRCMELIETGEVQRALQALLA